MDDQKTIFETLIKAAEQTYRSQADLRGFMPWPSDLRFNGSDPSRNHMGDIINAKDLPALNAIKSFPSDDPLVKIWQDSADHLYWKQSYRLDQVGQHFLNNYGYVEIFGPQGLFHSKEGRGFIGYWGADLYYPPHQHAAEEIYLILGGSVQFETPGQGAENLRQGQTRFHPSHQIHAMQTGPKGFITLALWRGPDMALPPQLSDKSC